MDNYQYALNVAYQNQTKLYEQSDGSSIHRPSDNPMNYSKLLRYKVSDHENEQYRANIAAASSWMHNSDAVMIHMTEIMKTIEEKSVAAANDTNTQSDCEAIYKEMFSNMQELIASANTQLGDRYIFAGQKDLTQPFNLSVDDRERGLPKTLDTPQINFFKPDAAGTNDKVVQMLTLEDKDTGETFYLDTETLNIYSKELVEVKYKDLTSIGYNNIREATEAYEAAKAAGDLSSLGEGFLRIFESGTSRGKINDSDFKVSKYFDNQGCLKIENEIEGDGPIKYKFKTILQRIVTYNGDENLISMVKLNGPTDPSSDTVNSTGERMFGRDIFDDEKSGNTASGCAMLNELLCVCAKTQAGDIKWMSSDGITLADVSHSRLLVEETRIGTRRQLFESVSSMLETHADNITEDINTVSGTDIARLATKLMEMTTLYNMSLSMGGRILPQSLADYL
ncbi:MAG: flagellar hook-associated protein 3 [Selenomonadaceae bacterium]|nr:flagellar hook-associated protein 3 [Selenomonadaceae bacterium]